MTRVRSPNSPELRAIEPGARTSEHRLSLGQEQVWLHSQLIADGSGYNEPVTLIHRGGMDAEVLRQALAEIVRRHEAWRTTFHERGGRPVAVVHDSGKVELTVVDLRELEPGDRAAEAMRRATEDARRPFDLQSGPLMRFLLVTMSDHEQRLYLALHQIVFDGSSIQHSFLPELAALYEDLVAGRGSSLADPEIQYQDFVRWQRAAYPDEVLAGELGYWQAQLGEAQPPLELPTDRQRPALQSYAGSQIVFSLDEGLSGELRAFSEREGVTLFVTLLTAFVVLLARRTGDEIQTIGSVTSVRKRPELERVPGFFLNTVAFRVDLSGDPSFQDALHRTDQVVEEGLNRVSVPIHRVLETLSVQHDSSRSPLFQAMFVLEPPLPEPPIAWESSAETVDVARARVDLHLDVEDRRGSLSGRMRYPTALFDDATVRALVGQWRTLLAAAIAEPGRSIGDLPVLSEGERAELLSARNRISASTPYEPFTADQVEQTISARFARMVRAFGDRPAIIEADREMTYRELDAAADDIARAVLVACPEAGARVGVVGESGAELTAAILGILKAGSAYVPLDPQFPARRLRSIALDAELDLVIVGNGYATQVRDALGDAVPIIEMAVAGGLGTGAPIDVATAADPAYLLYTSGSTGEPKGTIQSHRNVLHRIRVYTNALHIDANDRVLLVAKPTFVAWTVDLFGALLNGAAVCVVNLAGVGFVGLRDFIAHRGITIFHSTPTVYREVVATLGPPDRLRGVRAVALGGEEVRTLDFELFRTHFAEDGVFINIMGSTEASITLVFVADRTSKIDRPSVPAGYPAEATDVFLLDRYGRRTDFVGEIAVRSRYVAQGYWHRPDLTAAAFERDPSDPDLLVFRTGDLGRRLADGSLEFGGRRDRQIKVRGMRVEVAEIELALAALSGVRHVAVEARPIEGETRLFAYLEGSDAAAPTQEGLRAALRDRLPEYMVPSAFIWLDRIPQTSSGKIDRRALPAPGPKILTAAVAAPRDALEDTLIRIWEEILSRGPIGVHDDFFDLGGHSLLAVRLFDRIWRETGQRIPLSALLEGATVGQLAGRIREEKAATRNGLVPVQPAGTRRPLFVVPGVGSQILYLRNLAIHFGLDQPIYALHQSATGPGDRTERPIEELADEYVAALRSVQAQGPYDLVGFSFGGPVAYEIAQQLIADGETVGLLCLIDSRHPQQMRPSGFQPRFVARRFANQLRIVRRLGLRTGARYLRRRLWIARINSIAEARRLLRAGLPGLFARTLRDPAADVERAWVAADMRAYNGYRPKPYPGPITFLWAEHSQHPSAVFDTRRGWAELALGGFDARPIPGSHLTVLVEPLARITTAVLAEALGEARGRAEGRDSRDEPGTSGGTAGPAAGH